jgi:nucleoside 2-deoxyribosyltransferase
MNVFLKNRKVYLSSPIENRGSNHWKPAVKQKLAKEFGLDVYDPYDDPKQQWAPTLLKAREEKNYDEMSKIAKKFVWKDLAKVDRSDILIAYLPYKVATAGCHHEIIMANNLQKPVLLVCNKGKHLIPLWFYGFIDHKYMFGSWEDLYVFLRGVNDKKCIDDDKWAYIYDLI